MWPLSVSASSRTRELYEEVQRQREEVKRRFAERYGEELSSGFVCPAGGVEVAVAGGFLPS